MKGWQRKASRSWRGVARSRVWPPPSGPTRSSHHWARSICRLRRRISRRRRRHRRRRRSRVLSFFPCWLGCNWISITWGLLVRPITGFGLRAAQQMGLGLFVWLGPAQPIKERSSCPSMAIGGHKSDPHGDGCGRGEERRETHALLLRPRWRTRPTAETAAIAIAAAAAAWVTCVGFGTRGLVPTAHPFPYVFFVQIPPSSLVANRRMNAGMRACVLRSKLVNERFHGFGWLMPWGPADWSPTFLDLTTFFQRETHGIDY